MIVIILTLCFLVFLVDMAIIHITNPKDFPDWFAIGVVISTILSVITFLTLTFYLIAGAIING